MATSGSSVFQLDIGEVLQEAFELVGGEPILGVELPSARRSLNLLLTDFQNRGINLWALEAVVTAVSTSVGTYTLTPSTVDVLEAFIRRDSIDTPLKRLSFSDYAAIPNKTLTGKPSQIFIDRQRGAPVVHLWPLPASTSAPDSLYMWRVRRLEDVNTSRQDPDVPFRFLPALTTGLAYYLSKKRKGISLEKRAVLKAEYEEMLANAVSEDRDRADMEIKPRLRPI